MSFSEQFRQLIDDPASASCLVKWSFILVLMFVLLASAYQWLMLDNLSKLKQLQAQETELKQSFKDKHNQAYLLPFYRVQLQEIQKIFGEMIQTLPKQTEVAGLILDISEIAVTNGLRIQAFEPKAEILQKFYAEKPIYLKATGTYQQLATFASDLAVLPRIVSLHNIELSLLEQKQNKKDRHTHTAFNTMLEMQAIVKTFRYLAKETAPQ
jgi:type IV pilus assembly protein PilO